MEYLESGVNIHDLMIQGKFTDPHGYLGLQKLKGKQVIRIWRPGANVCRLQLMGTEVEAKAVGNAGLFEYVVPKEIKHQDYKVFHQSGLCAYDPYAFSLEIGPLDLHLLGRGLHYQLYNLLGAKVIRHQGVVGTHFAVWAPNAKSVSLIADFNHWNHFDNPMRCIGNTGVWEIFIPGVEEGEKYKFAIFTGDGQHLYKSDPLGHYAEIRPKTASIVFDVNRFSWTDEVWMKERIKFREGKVPMNVYELHLGSWQKGPHRAFLNYREMAQKIIPYCLEMGFTHVELMGICEHPLDESWGYQVTGYFAPTSRYGTPEDFQYMVNAFHEAKLGVFLDWVPAHFPGDEHGLAHFDGTPLYEHEDTRQKYHPHWNTHIFNFGRWEVANFLIASALFWFDKMHIDGLRCDAVASMIYLDYGRQEGEWIPNKYGSNINLEAIEFIKHLNSIIHKQFPDVLMIAEESTAFPAITRSLEEDGLGFDLKWNLGWMNDTLRFFSTFFPYRKYKLHELTFVFWFAYSEKFIQVLSHDEVVHGKGNFISKMPGDDWQKFAGMRQLLSFMHCSPGKKLLFMGAEIGQWSEWNSSEELHWYLLNYDRHEQFRQYVIQLNKFYLANPAFWERDFHPSGILWIDHFDWDNVVISYIRRSDNQNFLCVHHFEVVVHKNYRIYLRGVIEAKEVFNTDRAEYGGCGILNDEVLLVNKKKSGAEAIEITLPPLATLIFNITFASEDH